YVTGYAAAAALGAQGLAADAVAGHSIGEYAALAYAGVFSYREGLQLVRERGRLMQEAAAAKPGGMVAVLGLSAADLEICCAAARSEGVCQGVNFNSPEQVVVAGERRAVEKLAALATAKGAKRVIPLAVSGAFHSALMEDAARQMAERLRRVTFQNPRIPVAMNVDGQLRTGAQSVREALDKQLASPVQWVRTIEAMKGAGCSRFVECGPGRVLSGLLRRIDRQLESFPTDTMEALTQAAGALIPARRENA
ncbi:MAG TPA: ACP S-malonyltransferase, partial [Elusimicrobiota bacterium]|nr:ACP S-malonyltransferase [Elusimicrobiota bacterium]